MVENDTGSNLAKAKSFFKRANKVANTNNFDYAIEMYIEGLRCLPDALVEGHLKLHQLALLRQVRGGKKPSMVEKVKHLRGKTALDQMLNAEYLFAKDPDHLPYTEAMLKAAISGEYKKTANWTADLIFGANNAAAKASVQTYLLLKDSYAAIGQFDKAIAACQRASKLKPDDGTLADEFQRLSAELTVARGKYDQGGDFRNSIKNRAQQEKLQAQENVVKSEDYRAEAVANGRKQLAQDPELPKNIINLAEALADLQNDEGENEAVELLEKACETKKDFSFKKRAGEVRIRQIRRKIRDSKKVLEKNPDDGETKSQLSQLSEQLRSTETEHYRLCVENYPTDLQLKFEYAARLFQKKQYDDAIPLFQEAQRDPRHKISAMSKIGLCFFKKGWFLDAIDVFTQAIGEYHLDDDNVAKELRYNLARSYEDQGNVAESLDVYRKIAQLDFSYRDVRERVDQLRKKQAQQNSQ